MSMSKKKVDDKKKNPAAVALGRLGGAKGGKKRKKTTTEKRLSEIGFIGSVYGRLAKGLKVPKEQVDRAKKLQEKNKGR